MINSVPPLVANTTKEAAKATLVGLLQQGDSSQSTLDSSLADDYDSDSSFEIVSMDYGQQLGQSAPPIEWRTTFESSIINTLYYGDYMSPFRQLMVDMRASTTEDRANVIKALVKGRSHKIFATFSGRQADSADHHILEAATEYLIKASPSSITTIPGSPWVILTVEDKASVVKLANQKAVISTRHRRLVCFRPIVTKSSLVRVIELKNVRRVGELSEVRARLSVEGVVVTSQEPTEATWTPEHRERVVWKLQAPTTTWSCPTVVTLNHGRIYLAPSPICDVCHSDDHHATLCVWKKVLRSS